jgi:hypothetical protein
MYARITTVFYPQLIEDTVSDYGFSTIGSFFDTHEVHNPVSYMIRRKL